MTGAPGTAPHPGPVTITPLTGMPEVRAGDDLAALVVAALDRCGLTLADGDILAVSSKVASKALGLTAPPTDKAAVIAAETVRVVAERLAGEHITRIVESAAGPVMAAAGVDASNTGGRDVLLLLPHDPDEVCRALAEALRRATGVDRVGVVLTDTAGRPWRTGQTDFALGADGVTVLDDLRGSVDADGRPLLVTARAIADELAAAADLVKGKTSAVPVALVRGLGRYVVGGSAGARSLVRTGDSDWFALGAQEAVRAALGVPPGEPPGAEGIRPVSGDTTFRRVHRALDVAFQPHLDTWHAGVDIAVPVPIGDLIVEGPDAFAVGVVAARIEVALRGEGVPFERVSAPWTQADRTRVTFTLQV